jgi:uncharacterized membrane protein YfcA
MLETSDHASPYIVRHHPRDQVVIGILSLICIALLISSVAGIDIFTWLRQAISGDYAEGAYWLQWTALILSIGVYFMMASRSRRVDIENELREHKVEEARQRAYDALDRVDKNLKALQERENSGLKA